MKYPENTIQYFEEVWWVHDEKKRIQPGRLVWAYMPYIHHVPWTLVVHGRGDDPTDHTKVRFSIKPLKLTTPRDRQMLPAAAFPLGDQEIVLTWRAKRRPGLVIYAGEEHASPLVARLARWQKVPTAIIVPYFGASQENRAGFPKEFVERVKAAEYPNFYWDKLPISNREKEGSICKLDFAFPFGKHHDSLECTSYRLSADALTIIHEWMRWLFSGYMDPNGFLKLYRDELLEMKQKT